MSRTHPLAGLTDSEIRCLVSSHVRGIAIWPSVRRYFEQHGIPERYR